MSEAKLVAAIDAAIKHPGSVSPEQRRSQLIDAYSAVGLAAPRILHNKCLAIMKDTSARADTQHKILAIRVLDLFMDMQESSLAQELTSEINLFTAAAKRILHKDASKRRPPNFFGKRPNASADDVKKVLTALAELIDKWGRYYEDRSPTSRLHLWVEARRELQENKVPLPANPRDYQYVSINYSPAESMHAGTPPSGGLAGGLDEAEIARVAKEAERSAAEYGASSEQALVAKATLESLVTRWQSKAQEAADRDDFVEFERFSAVAFRFAELLKNLDALPSSGGSFGPSPEAPAMPTMASSFQAPPEFDGSSKGSSKSSKKDHRRHKSKSASPRGIEKKAVSTWDAGGAGNLHRTSGTEAWQSQVQHLDGFGGTGAQQERYASDRFGTHEVDGFSEHTSHGSRKVCDLEAQLERLRDKLHNVYKSEGHSDANVRRLSEQLWSVNQQIQSESMPYELAALQDQIGAKSEENAQLQRELDQCRHDIHAAHQKMSKLQSSLADRQELLADVHKRLSAEDDWVQTLQEEINHHSSLHDFLTGHLSDADLKSEELMHELAYIKKAFQDAHCEVPGPKGNVSYSCENTSQYFQRNGDLVMRPTVQQSDELAHSRRPDSPMSKEAAEMVIPRSTPDLWARTQLFAGSPGALIARSPPARREFTLKTHENFINLLVRDKGPLYEDPKLLMQIATNLDRSQRIPKLNIEIEVVNRGGFSIQQVQLVSKDPGYIHACELCLQAVATGAEAGTLWPHERLRWRGQLRVLAPFETGPQVELSYLLPDSMYCHARLRLPLSILWLMTPLQLQPQRFLELWDSNLFEQGEVAFVLRVRRDLIDPHSSTTCANVASLGGVLQVLHGLGESHTNIVLAASYPQRNIASPEMLVHVELGGPDGHGGPLCRVSVRAASNAAARALAQTLLDVLGECPDPDDRQGYGVQWPTAAAAS